MKIKYFETLHSSMSLLSRSEKRKVAILVFVQLTLTALDLISILLMGLIGSLAINGITSSLPGQQSRKILDILFLENLVIQQQVAILALFITFFLVTKTYLSYLLNKKILFFLSFRGAAISSELLKKVFSQGLLGLRNLTSQETLYSVTGGVTVVVVGVIGLTSVIISDLFLIFAIGIGLLVVSPESALLIIVFSALVAVLLHLKFRRAITFLSKKITELNIQSNEKILEAISTYRELIVRNRREFYAKKIGEQRIDLAQANAEQMLLPNLSKYAIESSLLICALLITGFQFVYNDAAQAVSTLAVFLAAGSRIAPALLRVQQSLMQIQGNAAAAELTLGLIRDLRDISAISQITSSIDYAHIGFAPEVKINNLTFGYPGHREKIFSSLDCIFPSGSRIGIIGSSGSGKSTLVDLLLGVIPPSSGSISISGLTPPEAVRRFPGAVAYVPQEIKVVNGSIRENICLGFEIDEFSDHQIWRALNQAVLADFVKQLDYGLDSQVGENGANLSGGQRQRLGIARALVLNPKLIVLDECTSSLDWNSQQEFLETIEKLSRDITVIAISHQIEFFRNFDFVLSIENGKTIFRPIEAQN